ncbi:MAG: hypothetical protein HY235_10475 [Acidobacteria bacterium]|nr:hypothetical protein [Acidobacteriota bacterium]
MSWRRLRKSRAAKPAAEEQARSAEAGASVRFQRLARKLDEIPAKDKLRIRQEQELENSQQAARKELYEQCRVLVAALNGMLEKLTIELTPDTYRAEAALFQMNASGRIVQIALEPPETAMSTERYRTWYIQRGALRWFNQDYLDRQEIRENLIYYCVGAEERGWRYVDPASRKSGALDQEYLAEILERLL